MESRVLLRGCRKDATCLSFCTRHLHSRVQVYGRQNSASSEMLSAVLTWEILISSSCQLLLVVLAPHLLLLPFLMFSLSPVFCICAIACAQWGVPIALIAQSLVQYPAMLVEQWLLLSKCSCLSEIFIQDCLECEHSCLRCCKRLELLQNSWSGIWVMINYLGLHSALMFQL